MLRREGYVGRITMLSADESEPCDRPNLRKVILQALHLRSSISSITRILQRARHRFEVGRSSNHDRHSESYVQLENGSRYTYDALLLATGAEPVRLEVPGEISLMYIICARWPTVARLSPRRGFTASSSNRASFIGLEVAASLRKRGIEVHVVGRETSPMEKILGADVGNFIRKLHEEHGVTFHLNTTATSIDAHSITLQNGEIIQADFIVVALAYVRQSNLQNRQG